MARPAIALAMMDGLAGMAFTPGQLERLGAAGEILDGVPLSDLADARAAEVLGAAEILVGHWGCPTLTPEVLAAAKRRPTSRA